MGIPNYNATASAGGLVTVASSPGTGRGPQSRCGGRRFMALRLGRNLDRDLLDELSPPPGSRLETQSRRCRFVTRSRSTHA